MSAQIQIIQISPEELKQSISTLLDSKFKHLESKLNSPKQEAYLTSKEVMKLLSISRGTLNNWKKNNKVSTYGIGGRRYYKQSEIDQLMTKL